MSQILGLASCIFTTLFLFFSYVNCSQVFACLQTVLSIRDSKEKKNRNRNRFRLSPTCLVLDQLVAAVSRVSYFTVN